MICCDNVLEVMLSGLEVDVIVAVLDPDVEHDVELEDDPD